jgi:hypothetical protein
MIQYGVPMLKNPEIDMIFLHDCPEVCNNDDIRMLENDIKWHLQQDAKDLCVKFYRIPKHDKGFSFIVIFLGGCKKIAEIVTYLKSKTWEIADFET